MNQFAEIYAKDRWTNGSGPGSHPKAFQPLKLFLQEFLKNNDVKSIVDFGCGDWQFMSQMDLTSINYIGLDVVDGLLEKNARKFGSDNISFRKTPSDLDDLPAADLLLAKDAFIHLTNEYVSSAIEQFGKYKFVISVNNYTDTPSEYNTDIEFGDFRPVDLTLPPFNADCATILRYGRLRILDPRLPPPLAFALRRYIWPGVKHVQLVRGGGPGRSADR